MKIINGDRCSGKSTRAREYVRHHNHTVLVVPSFQEAKRISIEETKYNPSCLFKVISWQEFIGSEKCGEMEYVIDELKDCLNQYGKKVCMITTTAEIKILKHKFKKGEAESMLKGIGRKLFKEQFPNINQKKEITC